MPISPVAIILVPLAASSLTRSLPTPMACITSSLVIAGSLAKFLDPRLEYVKTSPLSPQPDILSDETLLFTPSGVLSQAIPISTGITSAPAAIAIRHTLEVPLARLMATALVTS